MHLPGDRILSLAALPLVMGVLNITPDSFSDGGLFAEPAAAVEHARRMIAAGADLLDLGAESTRPGGGVYGEGAETVAVAEELRRLLPVLEAVRAETPLPISVDTRKAEVAAAAFAAGADLVNDISLLSDPELAASAADAGCPLIIMHSRGQLRTMQRRARYDDLLGDVRRELAEAVERAIASGVDRRQILIDPGIGFGKTARQNAVLLRRLAELGEMGLPVVVGASRKSFIAQLAGDSPPDGRLGGSLAAVAAAERAGAAIVRVHDVGETVQFLRILRAVDSSADETGEAAP
ncbi:MAG: dihydropteroate synthase [Thermoanaerobaculia bacterium]